MSACYSPEVITKALLRFHRRFGETRVSIHPLNAHEVRLVSESGGAASLYEINMLRALAGEDFLVLRDDLAILSSTGVSAVRRLYAGEDGFREQHTTITGGGEAARVDLGESPLGWLSARKTKSGKPYLAPYETEAGERLRQDFTLAGLNRRICMSWEPTGGRPGGRGQGNHAADISDFAIDARKRLDKALLALEPNLRGLLLDICCFLKGIEQVERERRWPRRSAKLVLKIALSQLAKHYQLLPRQHSDGIRHWGVEGYKPHINEF